jgi:hypothetical protein
MPTNQSKKEDGTKEKILALDSTGLKQYGKDEWHQEKHKIDPKRTWKKLHIAVDEGHIIRATLLTDKSMHDSEAVPELLDQISDPANRYVGDGGYDTKAVYDAINEHNTNAKIVIPPREGAVRSDQWHPERNKSLDIIEDHSRGGWCKMRKYGLQNYSELVMQR